MKSYLKQGLVVREGNSSIVGWEMKDCTFKFFLGNLARTLPPPPKKKVESSLKSNPFLDSKYNTSTHTHTHTTYTHTERETE